MRKNMKCNCDIDITEVSLQLEEQVQEYPLCLCYLDAQAGLPEEFLLQITKSK